MKWVKVIASVARVGLSALLLAWVAVLMLLWKVAIAETSIHQCVCGVQMAVLVISGYTVYRASLGIVSEAEALAGSYFTEDL